MENTNSIQTFIYEQVGKIRTVEINQEPWFILKDICEIFNDTNYRRVASRLDTDEKGVSQIATPGGMQSMIIINESGLYNTLFTMQPEKARGVSDEYIAKRIDDLKKFKRWITHDVIPSIRKTGTYMAPDTLQKALSDPRVMAEILTKLADEQDKNIKLQEENKLLNGVVESQKPAVEFAEHVSDTKDLLDMRNFAILAQKNGIDLGRNNMFKKLQELKYLDWNNVPYQKYIAAGYFKAIESVYKVGNAKHVAIQTFVTGKGQIYLIKKLRFLYGLSNDEPIDITA